MTDSESDISNPNVFTFQNVNTTVSARGPNTNITNFSFRNNQLTSSTFMPRNFERQRYAESMSDQRSIYYRRETSPMSIHSACDIRPRNFQQYYNGLGSNQSVFNGRSGSPMSIRSIDSSASVSAADIAFAFKNIKFNKYDLRVIKEAYNKLMKQRFRKRIEKRRNMKMFLKGRHRSGDDSGEQGSDSSISSDDCRSIKTSYKENMSCGGSSRMNLTDFRKTVRDNNSLKDYTENMRQNNFRNMFSVNASSRSNNFNSSSHLKQNNPIPTLKDRFKNGFVLPSQRFNRSVASSAIPENFERQPKNLEPNCRRNDNINCGANNQLENKDCESGSEEEIFSGVSIQSTYNNNKDPPSKRTLDSDDDVSLPEKKKSKISSPVKNSQINRKVPSKIKNNNPLNNNNENSNNFEFAKPTLPVRKSKPKVQEKVIAKSKQPLTGFVEHIPNKIVKNIPIINEDKPETVESVSNEDKPDTDNHQLQVDNLESTQNSDVSMRPSFIKRKLFTQRLDVAEKANLSSDGLNSPQSNMYSGLQKEKNKARKLVTTQSCLNREVQEENNLLDLIHKIVPRDQINVTNQTTINQTKTDVNNSNKRDDTDKWDVTSVISMCNENDVSDTFTDEDIFQNDFKNKDPKRNRKDEKPNTPKQTIQKAKQNIESKNQPPRECRIVVENLDCNQLLQKPPANQKSNLANTNVSKPAVKNSAKTFWDTDFESDAECQITTQKRYTQENKTKADNATIEAPNQEFKKPATDAKMNGLQSELQVLETSKWLNNIKNVTIMNNTLDSTRKFNISTLSVRSHRTTKKKKCCNEACFKEISPTKSVNKGKSTLKTETKSTNMSKPGTSTKNPTKPEIKNKTVSKSEIKNTITSKPESKTVKTTIAPNKNTVTKTDNKTEHRNKTPTKNNKTKLNTQSSSKSRSVSSTRQKTKETTSKPRKRTETTKIISDHLSPNDRPLRSCRTPSQNRSTEHSRSSRQFDITPLNVVAHRTRKNKSFNNTSLEEISAELEIKCKNPTSKQISNNPDKTLDRQNMKPAIRDIKTAKAKPNVNKSISILSTQKSPKKTKPKTNKQIQKKIQTYLTPKSDRPIRTCRTPGQNRTIENYKSSIRGR